MTKDDDAIVGREEEIARLGGFLDSAGRGPDALVLEGEAGIGKTTLWRWTLATARGRGFTVLSASPAAAETALSFSALDDLLEPVLGDVLPRLPAPRRAALEAALLLSASQAGHPRCTRSRRPCATRSGSWARCGRCSSPSTTRSGSIDRRPR